MEKSHKQLKIAIVHDHLAWGGGGERTALIMALDLGADFITAYASQATFPDYQNKLKSRLVLLAKKVISIRGIRFFHIRWIYFRQRKIFKKYDVLIASGQSALEAVAFYGSARATKILYNHTQPRRVYDLYETSKKMYPFFLRPLFVVFARAWKILYLKAIARIDVNIANSQNVRARAIKYTGRDVNYVVWPPILTKEFKWISSGDFFLSWARTDEAKRVELLVKAFQQMPDKKLIVASGGPRLDIVKSLAKGYPNITVLGWIDDQKLFELAGKCRAVVYIPMDEDAGMTPLEANAAGKPVLGVQEGGLKETIIDGQSGLLIKANPKEGDIIRAIQKMTPEWCESRQQVCVKNAQKYSKDSFIKKIKAIIKEHDPRLPILGVDASRWEDPRFPTERRRTGVEVYAYNIIKQIARLKNDKLRFRFYTQRSIGGLSRSEQKVLPGQKNWTRKLLNKELKSSRVDYFFSPAYYIPRNAPTSSFVTIHDVIFKSSPKKYSLIERLRQDYITRLNLHRAKKVITVSEYSKKEIIRYYKHPAKKIVSIPMGRPKISDIKISSEREKIILYIGRIEKKKSLDILLKAFASLGTEFKDWRLVLAGMDGHGAKEIGALIKELRPKANIQKKGYISETKKINLLSRAMILVHPSSEEGSCLPLFEAWVASLPAIVADTKLFKEIGGDACLFFQSFDELDLSKQIKLLAKDKELQNKIINKGREKIKKMSWEKTVQRLLSLILSDD